MVVFNILSNMKISVLVCLGQVNILFVCFCIPRKNPFIVLLWDRGSHLSHPYSWSVQFQFESRRERLKNTSYLSILVHQRKFSTAGRGGLGLIWAMGWKDQNLTDWTIWLHFPFGLPAYWAIFTGWGVSDAFFFNNALLSKQWEPSFHVITQTCNQVSEALKSGQSVNSRSPGGVTGLMLMMMIL